MVRLRNLIATALLTTAIAIAGGAGTAEAKKRKTVRLAVSISLFHAPSAGTDRFSGTVSARFPRCVQFVGVLLTKASGSSPFGPFTPPVQVVEIDSGPAGTFQILAEPSFVSPLTVHRYVAQTSAKTVKTRRKKIVCKPGFSPPVTAFQPAEGQ